MQNKAQVRAALIARRARRGLMMMAVLCLIGSLGCGIARRMINSPVLAFGTPVAQLPPSPTNTPRPTFTVTNTPRPTFTLTPSPTATSTPLPPSPPPTETATLLPTPTATNPPPPPPTFTPGPPTATPTVTHTPAPVYEYHQAELYQAPTTVTFLTVLVAVVNTQEIPIGGIKVVGRLEPGGYEFESALSTWRYEGYSAPGPVLKTGNVKFEPPGGFLDGVWTIHLEDEGGKRLSEDVEIWTSPDHPEWFFVKFKRWQG